MSEPTRLPTAVRFEHPAWEQQSYETDAAFLGFQCYAELGRGRTTEAAWAEYQKRRPPTTAASEGVKKGQKGSTAASRSFRAWKDANHWPQRARLFDMHEDLVRREAREEKIREIAKEHAQEAQTYRRALLPVPRSILLDLSKPEGREKIDKEMQAMGIVDRIETTAKLARALVALGAFEMAALGVPMKFPEEGAYGEGPDLGTTNGTANETDDEGMGTDGDRRGLIRRILADESSSNRAAWSVLDNVPGIGGSGGGAGVEASGADDAGGSGADAGPADAGADRGGGA